MSEATATKEPQTYGDLKRIVARTPRGDWPSRVNPSLTRSQAIDIFNAALKTHPDEQPITGNRGALFTKNIIRECRSRA